MKVSFNRKSQPDVVDGVQVPYGPGRREVSRWRWRLVVIVAASPLIYFLSTMAYHALTIEVPGQVSMTTYTLVAPVSGILTDMDIKAGQRLEKDRQTGRIIDPQLETRLALLTAEANDLAKREEEVRGSRPTGLEQALESARRNVADREEYLKKVETLMEEGAASMVEYNAARSDFEDARVAMGQLEETLPYAGGRIRAEQLEKEIAVLKAQAKLGTELRASQGGQVVLMSAVNGQFVMQGSPIMELAIPDTAVLLAYLPTKDLRRAEVGKRVSVRFDDGRTITATVSGLGLAARQRPSQFSNLLSSSELTLPITLVPDESIADMPFGLGFRAWFGVVFF